MFEKLFEKLKMGKKAQSLMVSLIISVTLAAVILARVGMPLITGANTSGWNATDITIYGIVGTFLLLSLIVAIAKASGFF